MNISVSKKEIFNEVEKRTSLEGAVLPDKYDLLYASERKGDLLNSYWIEGCTAAVQLFKRYLKGETVSHSLTEYDVDEVLSIEAEMPARFNTLLEGSVETDIKMMIACGVMAGWIKVVSPESAEKYEEEGNEYAESVRVKLLYRSEPHSNSVEAAKDETVICQCNSGLLYHIEDKEPLNQVRSSCMR